MESFNQQQSDNNHHQPQQQQIANNWMQFPPAAFFAAPPPVSIGPFTQPPPPPQSFFYPPPDPNFYRCLPPFSPMVNFNLPPPYRPGHLDVPPTDFASGSGPRDVLQKFPNKEQELDVLSPEICSLKEWLEARQESLISQASAKKPKWSITIPEFKGCLMRVKELSKKIKTLSSCLSEECRNCSCDLELEQGQEDLPVVHRESMTVAQNEIRSIQSRIDKHKVEEVKKKLDRIKRKRDRLRRKKRREQVEEELREERRKKMEEAIDIKMARAAEAEANVKKEKEISREADGILYEVKRKIADARKGVRMLQVLRKLREVRSNRKAVLMATEVTEAFEERMQNLLSFMKGQLSVYESEQKALQVMLDTEQEADREREMTRKRNKMEREVNVEMEGIKRLLFGDENMEPSDPRFPFFQLYELPNQDPNIFLQVRHQWDRFLVARGTPGSSRIPPSWVTPSEPTSDLWAEWLHSNGPGVV